MSVIHNMTISPHYRCFVYFNLHTGLWSIRQRGKVVAHVRKITLANCRLLVGPKGRERVLREKRKNVHAGISGYICPMNYTGGMPVTYNPYKYSSFVTLEGEPIHMADIITLDLDQSHKVVAFGTKP